jgi:hypothetical protein
VTSEATDVVPRRLHWLIFWLSASVLAFEIALMRILLIASWHHFAFLVISVVLLGFGASGTALTIARRWVMPRAPGVLLLLAVLTAVSMPVCVALAQLVPVEARFAPALFWSQLTDWLVFWALLTVPFLIGASVIGLSLMTAGQRVGGVYAANLLGSGLGALVAPGLMFLLPPAWLATVTAIPALVGAAAFPIGWRMPGTIVVALSAVLIAGMPIAHRPGIRVDPYKDAARLELLVEQDEAALIGRRLGPCAVVEAYASETFHDLPFLGVGETPPPVSVITLDGLKAGSVLDVARPGEAGVMDRTLMAFPYELAPAEPRVALLDEIGGANIWLAARHGASRIDAIQPHEAVFELMRNALVGRGGEAVLDLPAVRPVAAEPRHFIDHVDARYDVIQLVALQSSAAGSGGIGGLAQDFLITRQGIRACLERLSDDGVLFVCRGIQTPPRDNLKLLATFIAALRRLGIDDPAPHFVIVRDYLAVCTIVRMQPWSTEDVDRVRELIGERQLTPVWYPGIRPEELNQPDALPSPPDGVGDWYHFGAQRLFSDDAQSFIDGWAFDIRPPTDDRPFFHDLCRFDSLGAMRRAYGDLWLTRTEVAYLFVLAAAVAIVIVGALLILLPLPWLRSARLGSGGVALLGYFTAIGLAYLLLEMTCLARLTRMIGDPVLTAAVTIAGFLVLSGFGSMTAQRIGDRARGIRMLFAVLAALVLLSTVTVGPATALAGGLPIAFRCVIALIAIAPLAYVMGFPMPLALMRLDRSAPSALPWAWGVNGFASVLATPLATILGMTWGYLTAGLAAVGLYGLAGLVFGLLPRDLAKA